MKKNMGTLDRILRVLIAVIVIGVYFTTTFLSGVAAIILLILSGVFIVTSFVSFCPLYLPFRFNTNSKVKELHNPAA